MRWLDTKTRKLIREKVEEALPPGPRRDARLFEYLCGEKAIPRRRDFLELLIPVKDKHTGQWTKWDLNKAQRLVEATRRRDERRGVQGRYATLKARQFGMSVYWLGSSIEMVTRRKDSSALIVADKTDTARKLLELGKQIRSRLPYRLPTKYENRSQLYFDEPYNAHIDIESAEADEPGRGKTYRWIHCTEPAFWKDPDRKVISLMQAIPSRPDTLLSFESTANGVGNWWHEFWFKAHEGLNDYTAFFFPWYYDSAFDYCLPVHHGEEKEILDTLDEEETFLLGQGCNVGQIKWRRHAIRNLCFGDIDYFHQEYPAQPEEAFLATGRPVFATKLVLRAMNGAKDPIWKGDLIIRGEKDEKLDFSRAADDRGALTIWEEPDPMRMYVIGIDSGEGTQGGDPGCVAVIDLETGFQVAEYNEVREPWSFGQLCACLGWLYNSAYAMPEMNGPGMTTFQAMVQSGYHMVGRRPSFDTAGRQQTVKLGWHTNVNTKPLLINAIREQLAIEEDGAKINSRALCKEMLAFQVNERGTYETPSGKHDDRIIAWGIAILARRDALDKGLADEKPQKEPQTLEEKHWAEYEAQAAQTSRWEDVEDDLY